jgi:hypothetical protein
VQVVGAFTAITLGMFDTPPCGRLGVNEHARCGADVRAAIVATGGDTDWCVAAVAGATTAYEASHKDARLNCPHDW